MTSGIYAIARVGHLKLYVGDASSIRVIWPPLLAQLNGGYHPNPLLQEVWNREGNKRRFSFHTWQDIATDPTVVGIE